jgi:transglutaminase-like putative cysteine protease
MQIPETDNQLRVTLQALPDGVPGIKATLALMVKLARQAKESYVVRRLAEQLTASVRQKDWLNEVRAIHEYVRDHVRYVKDIRGIETVATPDQTISRLMGDCDDKSLLTAALLESIGHPTRFVAVGRTPNNYVHVLVETKIANRWIPVETTENVAVGWYPPGMVARLVYHV